LKRALGACARTNADAQSNAQSASAVAPVRLKRRFIIPLLRSISGMMDAAG
jgi:hypothetical protein